MIIDYASEMKNVMHGSEFESSSVALVSIIVDGIGSGIPSLHILAFFGFDSIRV